MQALTVVNNLCRRKYRSKSVKANNNGNFFHPFVNTPTFDNDAFPQNARMSLNSISEPSTAAKCPPLGWTLKTTELTVQISIEKGVINSKLTERVFIPPLGWLIIVEPIVELFC